jgi:hypothetical protein
VAGGAAEAVLVDGVAVLEEEALVGDPIEGKPAAMAVAGALLVTTES